MGLLHRHTPERVIYLDEDVYAALGDSARPEAQRSAWAPSGSYGPVPENATIGPLGEVLGGLGLELWRAKRRGAEVCLLEPAPRYDAATALYWGADAVEHMALRVRGIDGNVVESLALARKYARDHRYESAEAQRLGGEARKLAEHLRVGGAWAFGRGLLSRASELEIGSGLLNPGVTEYESTEFATAELRAMQVALMHATEALVGADPLAAGREAARWCRRASARNALAQEAGDRRNKAEDASWWNLYLNPFARGTLARSLPGQVRAIQDGDIPEREWQAARLHEYLERDDDEPLRKPWL